MRKKKRQLCTITSVGWNSVFETDGTYILLRDGERDWAGDSERGLGVRRALIGPQNADEGEPPRGNTPFLNTPGPPSYLNLSLPTQKKNLPRKFCVRASDCLLSPIPLLFISPSLSLSHSIFFWFSSRNCRGARRRESRKDSVSATFQPTRTLPLITIITATSKDFDSITINCVDQPDSRDKVED